MQGSMSPKLSARDSFSLQIKVRTELNPGICVNLLSRQFWGFFAHE